MIGAKSLLIRESKQTTIKKRVISNQKYQMIRIDEENTTPISCEKIINKIERNNIQDYDIIIVSDYNKGFISKELLSFLRRYFDKSKIIVDPKPENIDYYHSVYAITPNRKEWEKIKKQRILKTIRYIIITMGENGIRIYNTKEKKIYRIFSKRVPVYNVSGAGDVVIAILSIGLSMGLKIYEAARLANRCAGYAVTQPQTCTIPKNKFIEFLYNEKLTNYRR